MKRQSRHIAGISLGVMVAGFAVTLPYEASVAGTILLGGFEAGLVGGLADWFAVSALFRHPLGIPIPHTSLLSRNRAKLTKALVRAVEQELLHKESIANKLKQFPIFATVLKLVERELDSESAKRAVVSMSEFLVKSIPVDQVVQLMKREAGQLINSIDVAALLDRVSEEVIPRKYDEKALDFVLDRTAEWAIKSETRDSIGRMAQEALSKLEISGFMQFAVNAFIGFMSEDKLGSMLQQFIVAKVDELRQTDNDQRAALLAVIRESLHAIKHNPTVLAELESWKQRVITHPGLADKLSQIADQLQQRMIDFIQNPDYADQFAIPLLKRIGEHLQGNDALIERGENWIQAQLVLLVEKHHSKIGKLVEENIEKLDNAKLTEMIEDKVGTDLQWIRVNGAICGFMIGILLALLQWLI